jgi:hypothetical protein
MSSVLLLCLVLLLRLLRLLFQFLQFPNKQNNRAGYEEKDRMNETNEFLKQWNQQLTLTTLAFDPESEFLRNPAQNHQFHQLSQQSFLPCLRPHCLHQWVPKNRIMAIFN